MLGLELELGLGSVRYLSENHRRNVCYPGVHDWPRPVAGVRARRPLLGASLAAAARCWLLGSQASLLLAPRQIGGPLIGQTCQFDLGNLQAVPFGGKLIVERRLLRLGGRERRQHLMLGHLCE